MTKILEGLASRTAERCKAKNLARCEYAAAFLAERANVIEASAAGFSLRTIWEHMHETGRIPFRYETFLRYVQRYITKEESQ